MAALHELSADELSAAYRIRQLSPVEVTRAVLDRMEVWEPKINAMYLIDAAGGLAPRSWRAMGLWRSVPTSAAPCACRRPTTAFSRSSRVSAGSRSIRLTSAG